jgi:hypothetical protein
MAKSLDMKADNQIFAGLMNGFGLKDKVRSCAPKNSKYRSFEHNRALAGCNSAFAVAISQPLQAVACSWADLARTDCAVSCLLLCCGWG